MTTRRKGGGGREAQGLLHPSGSGQELEGSYFPEKGGAFRVPVPVRPAQARAELRAPTCPLSGQSRAVDNLPHDMSAHGRVRLCRDVGWA